MVKTGTVRRSPAGYRLAFFALLVMAMVTATLHVGSATAEAAQATLSWTAPTTNTDGTTLTDLSGYNVYIGTASGSYSQKLNAGNVTSYTASNLIDGSTYYFAVTAYDSTGTESKYSNEVSKTFGSTYTISATAGSGGTITALNNSSVSTATNSTSTITSVTVASGASQSFSITPSTGYALQSVTVDGTSVGAVTSYTFSNVTANHTISATFASSAPTTASYTISASAGSNGTISPSGSTTVTSGGSKSFTVTPNTGYYVVGVTVDGATVASNIAGGAGYTYTFSNVTANHTISATFGIRYYNIVGTAGTGGSISPANTWVLYNTSQTVSITPASGYHVAGVTVDGASVGAVTSYTFSNVSADHTLSATFSNTTSSYTISASAGSNGSISPSGSVSVATGGSKSFTVTPNTGYYVVGVTVDGATVASNIAGGAGYTYTFSNVTANHTISATFGIRYYNIVGTAGTGGSISPANTWVLYNTSQTVSITPASGYHVTGVTVDGASVGAVTSYTFSNVSADHTLSATFSNTTSSYTISASAGSNGSISPSGSVSVATGGSQSFTITPNTGYYVVSVVVDGSTVASNIPSGGYTYSFSNVSGNHTISATFGIRYYNIVATAGSNGSVSPANTWVLYNTPQTVSITPASGHQIANVTVDGVSVGAVSSYTFQNVSAGHTLAATFL